MRGPPRSKSPTQLGWSTGGPLIQGISKPNSGGSTKFVRLLSQREVSRAKLTWENNEDSSCLQSERYHMPFGTVPFVPQSIIKAGSHMSGCGFVGFTTHRGPHGTKIERADDCGEGQLWSIPDASSTPRLVTGDTPSAVHYDHLNDGCCRQAAGL